MNVFIALKGSHFWFLFDFTAAGVVPCVSPFSLLLKDLISDFYLTSLQLVLCRVAAVKRLPVHQP